MKFSDYIIYVDEGGDHDLTQDVSIYPIFCLAFCIFKKDEYIAQVVPALQRLKFKWFGHDAYILHEREVRKQIRAFLFKSKSEADAFMADITALITTSPMTVISAVIDKTALKGRYSDPDNPYDLALQFCIERTVHFLREHAQGDRLTNIIVERRGKKEDKDLELQFRRICSGKNYLGKINSLDILFVDKKANSAGLQIADLLARPVGLKVLRLGQPNRAYDVVESKFRRGKGGKFHGYGFKVLP